ncbi:MAG: ABC transporter substrate-binding protein [Bellilinea sp.]
MKRFTLLVVGLLVIASMVLSACVPATPQVVTTPEVVTEVKTVVVEKPVEVVVTPTPVPVDRDGAWLDTIVVVEEPSADAAVTRLINRDIDMYAFTVSNAEVAARVAASPELRSERSFGSYNELTFNPAGPIFEGTGKLNPFAVPAAREAMNYLVDRNYIVQEIMKGLAVPRYLPFNGASADYARLAGVARQLELRYAYDLEKARELLGAEMEKLGATLVDGKWQFEGEPVVIIVLIRTEDERRIIGDYVATQLEEIGFTTVRDYKTAAEASPIWIRGTQSDGLYHVYTGGWITTAVPRDLGDNFSFFYTPRGLAFPLWQAYTPSEEFDQLALALENREYTTLEERTEMMSQALELSMQDSVRVWLVDRAAITPMRAEVRVASDLYGAVSGSQLWPYTIRREGEVGGSMTIAMPSILTEPWNALDGSNWIYDQMLIRGTGEFGTVFDPFTGLPHANKIERAEVVVQEGLPVGVTLDWLTLDFEPTIEVPADAWADWNAETQTFVTVGEKFPDGVTALRKSTVYYPADLFETVKWHDGSPFSVGDIVMYMIQQFDRGKAESPYFDESVAPRVEAFLTPFKGVRIVSTDPLVIETYSDLWNLDAEMNVDTWFPHYLFGSASWHALSIGLRADGAGEAAFSSAKADANEIEWLSYIAGPTIDVLKANLDGAAAEGFIPYAPTLGQFVTAEEAAARYANLAEWFRVRGHFWIGTNVFYLERAFPVEGTVILKRFIDHPVPADRWLGFTTPAIAEVEVDGEDRVTIGGEATFDVFVDFEGAPYPVDNIDSVKFLVFDATGAMVQEGMAEAVEDGLFQVTLSADDTSNLPEGATRLEVVVVSKVVAVPSFASFQFVTTP